jgi:hypothetical protein
VWVDRDEQDYTWSNHLQFASAQYACAANKGGFQLPKGVKDVDCSGSAAHYGLGIGTVEIKAALLDLGPAPLLPGGSLDAAKAAKEFPTFFLFPDPVELDYPSDDRVGGKPIGNQLNRLVGLVGLHIIRRVPGAQQFRVVDVRASRQRPEHRPDAAAAEVDVQLTQRSAAQSQYQPVAVSQQRPVLLRPEPDRALDADRRDRARREQRVLVAAATAQKLDLPALRARPGAVAAARLSHPARRRRRTADIFAGDELLRAASQRRGHDARDVRANDDLRDVPRRRRSRGDARAEQERSADGARKRRRRTRLPRLGEGDRSTLKARSATVGDGPPTPIPEPTGPPHASDFSFLFGDHGLPGTPAPVTRSRR